MIEAYHGTENLSAIVRHGIRVGHNSLVDYPEEATFLTSDFREAWAYSKAGGFYNMHSGGVVKVRLPSSFHIIGIEQSKEEPYGWNVPGIFPDHPRKGEIWYVVENRIPPEFIAEVWPASLKFRSPKTNIKVNYRFAR